MKGRQQIKAQAKSLKRQIKETQNAIDVYEYNPEIFEEKYKQHLNEEGDVVINGNRFERSVYFARIGPNFFRYWAK